MLLIKKGDKEVSVPRLSFAGPVGSSFKCFPSDCFTGGSCIQEHSDLQKSAGNTWNKVWEEHWVTHMFQGAHAHFQRPEQHSVCMRGQPLHLLLLSSTSSSPKYFKRSSLSAAEVFEKKHRGDFYFYFKMAAKSLNAYKWWGVFGVVFGVPVIFRFRVSLVFF